MATNRVLLGLFVVNLLVTALLAVWVVSVATGNDSWLPAAVNPAPSTVEDLEQLGAEVDAVDAKAQAAGELASSACEGSLDMVGQLQSFYDIEVYGPDCGIPDGYDFYDSW